MKKKFLALVLTLAMVLSLAPVGALATDGEESQKPEDVIYNKDDYNKNAQVDGVDSLNKTAEKTGENTYKVTLEVKMHETTTTSINSQTAATVLVIDVSNSMDWHVVCGRDEHKHTRDCYTFGWLTCEETEHTHTDACGESRLDAAKAAAENFVNTYAGTVENAGRYLSIVVFGTNADVTLDWTDVSTDSGKNSAKSAIDVLSVKGGTNLEQGLANAKSKLEEHTVSSVNFKNVVALTDGAPTYYGAPDKWGNPSGGDGSNGSKGINEKTAETARNLKEIANLYTVCFGAANQYTYKEYHLIGGTTYGPTVGKFLEKSIATDSNHAYNADNADKLNNVFKEISQNITSGLSAGTVHDALPKGVSSDAFNGKTTADWDLNTFDKEITDEGNTKHYTYTKTYTVTIDPEEINPDLLDKNDYYPLNGQTTLKVTVNNEEQELNFPIPYGKVKFNTYSVTYKDGAEGAVFDDSITDNLRKGANIPAYDNEDSIHRDGYTFSGWKWYQGETELTAKPNTMPAANLVAVAQWTAKTYTVTFNANGGAWDQNVTIDGYTFNDVANKTMATNSTLLASDTISDVTHPKKENAVFKGWAASPTATADEAILAFSYESPFTVAKLKEWTKATGATITLYAIWDESPITYKYTIIQHFMNEKGKQDGEPSVNPTGTAAKDTLISNLIPSNLISADTRYSSNGKEYLYENAKVDTENYTGNETLQADNTQIHLYYYLDSWKDGKGNNPDSKNDGDGIPDYKQILVEYHAIPATEGTVTPAVEVHTLDANKTPITLDGSKAEKVATSNFVFAYWISGNVDNSKTADQIEAGAISYNAQLSDVQVTPEGGETYIYTAIFLKDVVGNPNGPDGIPDIWQYKVTFNVVGGNWNDTNNNNKVVRYVTRE